MMGLHDMFPERLFDLLTHTHTDSMRKQYSAAFAIAASKRFIAVSLYYYALARREGGNKCCFCPSVGFKNPKA